MNWFHRKPKPPTPVAPRDPQRAFVVRTLYDGSIDSARDSTALVSSGGGTFVTGFTGADAAEAAIEFADNANVDHGVYSKRAGVEARVYYHPIVLSHPAYDRWSAYYVWQRAGATL